jgi:hypothetical protein
MDEVDFVLLIGAWDMSFGVKSTSLRTEVSNKVGDTSVIQQLRDNIAGDFGGCFPILL